MNLAETFNDLSQVIFPPQCLGCAEIIPSVKDQIFCRDCAKHVHFIAGSICPVCGTTFPDSPAENHLCEDCLKKQPYFSQARAVFCYEAVILDAIHQFKYKRDIASGEILADFMADYPFPDIAFDDYSLIVPVPLHVKRLRERGFNQSLILARRLAKRKQIPVDFLVLKRHRFTSTQAQSNKQERKQNIRGAFEVSVIKTIAGRNILLIDDVFTTGATVNECSKTLMKAGAKNVSVLTLARVLQHVSF